MHDWSGLCERLTTTHGRSIERSSNEEQVGLIAHDTLKCTRRLFLMKSLNYFSNSSTL